MTRKIIDGKVYDHRKATNVAAHTVETLYLTQDRAWFIVDGTSLYHPKFKPISAEKAYEWLYYYSFSEEIKQYFPNRIVDA